MSIIEVLEGDITKLKVDAIVNAANEAVLLTSCYQNSLHLAVENQVRSIAFPAISCGIYGYPMDQAVEIAVRATKAFLHENNSIEKVIFVCFGQAIYDLYLSQTS